MPDKIESGNRNGADTTEQINKVEVVTLPNGQRAEAIIFYVGIKGAKGCPFLGALTSPLRGEKRGNGVNVLYCINPTVVNAARHSRAKGLMLVKCCSTLPTNKWNPADDTRDCTLG